MEHLVSECSTDVWSYSPQSEILEYFKGLVSQYDLAKSIQLNKQVIHAEWDEDGGIWSVKVKDIATGMVLTDWCNVFINAGGILK